MKRPTTDSTLRFYEFGSFRLDPVRRRLYNGDQFIPLYPKAVEALIFLVEHSGEILQREALMQALWPDAIVEEQNLTVAIANLRRVLGRNGNGIAEFIQTIPRVGYRFVVQTREVAEEPTPHLVERHPIATQSVEPQVFNAGPGVLSPQPVQSKDHESAEASGHPGAGEPRKQARWVFALAVGALVVTALAVVLLRNTSFTRTVPIRSVAVLPLKNLTGSPNDEYLADGLTEGLIGSLSKLDGLKVISRGSVFAFKGKDIHPHQVGKELGVMSVIEGGVLRSNGAERVSLRLVDTADGRVLWSHDTAPRSHTDSFEIQEELARRTAVALRPKLAAKGGYRLEHEYPKNSEAYLEYLKGRYFWNKRSAADAEQAIQHFERAIALEPNYSQAYAGLADCYAIRSRLPPRVAIPKAMAAALKAIDLDPDIAEAHVSLGTIKELYEWDRKAAEAEYKRAIELNPNYALAHGLYSVFLTSIGRFDEGAAEARRGEEIDPLSANMHIWAGWNFLNARQYDLAIEEAKKAIAIDSNVSMAYNILSRAYSLKQMPGKGIEAAEKAILISNQGLSMMSKEHPLSLASLGYAYALSRRGNEARRTIAELEDLASKTYISPGHFAVIYAAFGEQERVLEYLEKTFEERDEMQRFVKVSPIFDGVHSDPRFIDLLRRVGFSP